MKTPSLVPLYPEGSLSVSVVELIGPITSFDADTQWFLPPFCLPEWSSKSQSAGGKVQVRTLGKLWHSPNIGGWGRLPPDPAGIIITPYLQSKRGA